MYSSLQDHIRNAEADFPAIIQERKDSLRDIAVYIRKRLKRSEPAKLIFICTHNSRRSHFAQVWAAMGAFHYGVESIESYSGGTEATEVSPAALKALERAGFQVTSPTGKNPYHQLRFDPLYLPLTCFSKTFDDPANPDHDFAAIMTCSDADERCPLVPGAHFRSSIPYRDPKEADGSPQEDEVYDQCCLQIATEMLYMMSMVKSTGTLPYRKP